MSLDSSPSLTEHSAAGTAAHQTPVKRARVWPAALLVALFWIVYCAPRFIEMPIFAQFFTSVIATGLLTFLFFVWWTLNRGIAGRERLWGLAALFVGAVVAIALSQNTLGTIGALMFGLPVAFTAWAIWLLTAQRLVGSMRIAGLVAVLAASWGAMTLLRMDGLTGDLQTDVNWRWAPKPEDLYLAELAATKGDAPESDEAAAQDEPGQTLTIAPGDWPALRGVNRDGVVTGLHIATDWDQHPPRALWRHRVGPGWSSIVIVDGRLFTQEQRGEQECVVCLNADTGHQRWVHGDDARFWDGQAGTGPRGTPTFDQGRIYALGATGLLNCLDAATGKEIWQRNIVTDAAAPTPMWGFVSSSLVAGGTVIVYAGGPDGKGLLGYRADSGELAWTAAAGPNSYTSPQPIVVNGQTQVLLLSDRGLVAVQPETGEVFWTHDATRDSIWRAVQPRSIGEGSVVFGSEDLGLVRLDLADRGSDWTASERWTSKAMKPAYNDFVLTDRFIYGFDAGIFCCVDAEKGTRRWKAGRYGHGQVLLLADQQLLLVLSETGDVALVAAQPDEYRELARFHAIDGKTWNHPAIAHGRLYVRNDEEMACYELPAGEAESTPDGK